PSDHTTIINSLIGTSATGSNGINTLGNRGDGILITGSNHSDVGFYSDGSGDHPAGNVISGNLDGIHLTETSSATDIRFNKIGTDISGTFALGNKAYGVLVENVQSDTTIGTTSIGGTTDSAGKLVAGNLVSGNVQGGIGVLNGNGGLVIIGNF